MATEKQCSDCGWYRDGHSPNCPQRGAQKTVNVTQEWRVAPKPSVELRVKPVDLWARSRRR